MAANGVVLLGQNRNSLVNTTTVAASGGAVDFGAFPADKYSRIVGMFSVVGSFTFRHRYAAVSGTYLVTSTTVVNSGGSTFDVLNHGAFVELGFTDVVSSEPAVYLAGEPVR